MSIKAMKGAVQLINDLMAVRYSEEFNSDDVDAADTRIANNGGTAAYCADVLQTLRQAIESAEKVEVQAWLIPHLLDIKGAKKVHFTRSEAGANLTDEELTDSIHGTVSWGASLLGDGGSVTDKHGTVHHPIPLYTTPPARKPLSEEEIEDICWTEVDQRMRSFARAIERAHGIGETK